MDREYSVGFTFGSIGITFGTVSFIIIYILFIRNLMGLLRNVQPDNRQVQPGIVWILGLHFLSAIITLPFNLEWMEYNYFPVTNVIRISVSVFMTAFQFYLFVKIANSVALEYDNRDIEYVHKPTFLAGVWLAIVYTGIFILNLFDIFYLSIFAMLSYFVAFVVYWFQISTAKWMLSNTSIKIKTTDEDSIFKDI